MKKQIRYGVFESNSSSTHTLTIVTEAEFDAWKKGKMFYDSWDDKLVKSKDECKYPEDNCETYDEWCDDDYLETYYERYTTENGDKIVAFGKYGYN